MRPRDLGRVCKEVEAMRDSCGEPVDKKIKDLVIGLGRWGVKTEASCQGHFFHGFPYPWIDILWESLEDLTRLIGLHWWHLSEGGLKEPASGQSSWVIKPIGGTSLRMMPEDKGRWKLRRLQKEAMGFGKFLQMIPSDFFDRLEEGGSE